MHAAAAFAQLPSSAPAARANAEALQVGGVRVVFPAGKRAVAEAIARAASEPLPLPGFADSAALTRATIILASTPGEFRTAAGGGVPPWAAGIAIPTRRTIVLPSYSTAAGSRSDPRVVLRHEIAHLALAERLPVAIPRWFTEGYATWVSGEWDQGSSWQIRLAFLLGRAPPLDSLNLNWPRDAQQARLAYLLSASAVRHLATRNGPHAFDALLSAWNREGTLDAALRSVYGITLGQFEEEWVKMVRRRYGWLLALSQVTVFWGLLTALLLLLSIPRFRRKRAQLARLEWEDRIFPPPPGWDTDAEATEESEPAVAAANALLDLPDALPQSGAPGAETPPPPAVMPPRLDGEQRTG